MALGSIIPSVVTRARVPKDPASVTTIGRSEVEPRAVGADSKALARAWSDLERLYKSGIHPAIQLCVRCRGEVIFDRAIGYARGGGPSDKPGAPKVLCTPDTPFDIFSASKAVTAMVVHLLDQRHLIHLDD